MASYLSELEKECKAWYFVAGSGVRLKYNNSCSTYIYVSRVLILAAVKMLHNYFTTEFNKPILTNFFSLCFSLVKLMHRYLKYDFSKRLE